MQVIGAHFGTLYMMNTRTDNELNQKSQIHKWYMWDQQEWLMLPLS
jgi:hypothetical protein